MTMNGRPGRPVAVAHADGSLDLFARGADDSLLHLHHHPFLGWSARSESGHLAGDPTAVLTTGQQLHVFARGRGSRLLHWRTDPTDGRLVGPIDHGARIGYDPVAVAGPAGSVGVYARGTHNGDEEPVLAWWSSDGETLGAVQDMGGTASTGPGAVYRPGQPVPDVFVADANGHLAHRGTIPVAPVHLGDTREGWELVEGDPATGAHFSRLSDTPPVAVSWSVGRIDVLAATQPIPGFTKLAMSHWGYKATDTRRWFGPDFMDRGTTLGPACVVTTAPDHAEAFARNADGQLVRWWWARGGFSHDVGWDAELIDARSASGPVLFGSEPTAVVRDAGRTYVYAWDRLGTRLWEVTHDGANWSAHDPEIRWPGTGSVGTPTRRVPIDVRAVVSRPADLLTLGVSWSGLDLISGDPPKLRRTGGPAFLRVALPPQHVGEEVSPADGPLVPPVTGISPHGVWRSLLSGPSQLVVVVTDDEIPLTTEGVLRALKDAPMRFEEPGDDETGASGLPFTEIELPWQLFISPDGATATHTTLAQAQGSDIVPLWRSRISSPHGALRILSAHGQEEPFDLPLGRAARESLVVAPGPAVAERLELSSLGGTLQASGSWPDLEWEHNASIGRDHRVRVLMRGMLYPFGHQAQYLELTERFPAEPGSEPVAALRKRRVLTVTEPVRRLDVDDAQGSGRAFPFDHVTITTRTFEGLDSPDVSSEGVSTDWRGRLRRRKNPDGLQTALEAKRAELLTPLGLLPPVGSRLVIEHMATGTPNDEATRLAEERLLLVEQYLDLKEQIEAVKELGDQFINEFFCPRRGGTWVEFPVTCQGRGAPVSFTIPMLFVVDRQLPETQTMEAFDTFDEQADGRLATEWATIRSQREAVADSADPDEVYAGVVAAPGTAIDLVRAPADQVKPEDVQVVKGLHVTGMVVGRELRPRLGPRPGTEPSGPQWGMDITLPAIRSLLPDQGGAHRALVAFAPGFEAGTDVAVALRLARSGVEAAQAAQELAAGRTPEAAQILLDFTRDADRSGGLVAPKMAADAISRVAGPLNEAGLADPKQLFDKAATLLGVSLRDLLAGLPAGTTPTITTDLSTPQPVVSMCWPQQVLQPFAPFGSKVVKEGAPPPPQPTLTLDVTTCGPAVSSVCTVTDFSLSFPTGKPLLILNFDWLKYHQESGHEPTLDVGGLDVQFSEELDILQSLQGASPLAGKGPTFEVSEQGIVAAYSLPIPDASAGAFVMRNLLFSARVVVPFQGDPVSVAVAFASRAKPFNLSVMMLGGGGYVDVELDGRGLRRLDVALEFGASVAVDFVIASGEAHILGGIRFQLLPNKSVALVGFLRIGGSLEVLGLVSVSVEMVLTLGYQSHGNKLVGRATLVIEIDLTIYSDSVEIDSGEWTIAGGDETDRDLPAPAPSQDDYAQMWQQHRSAYEPTP